MAAGDGGEDFGERAVSGNIARHRENPGDAGGGLAGHLLNAADEYGFVNPMRDRLPGGVEGGTGGGASGFVARGRNADDSSRGGNVRGEVALTGKAGSGEVAKVKCFDRAGRDPGVGKRILHGFDGQ